MESKRTNQEIEHNRDDIHSSRGTFFAVLMVGAFIALTFVLIFGLYMSRV